MLPMYRLCQSLTLGLLTMAPLMASAAGPRVDLLTMGPSEQIYARFGHAALRVHDGRNDTVFNFGYTDFSSEQLLLDTLQGHAQFWGVRMSMQRTLDEYLRQDRTIYWQPLSLSPAQHASLAAKLQQQVRGRAGSYIYHHYYENCSTRLRDLIDETLEGQVRLQLQGRPVGKTFRQLSREGLADSLPLLFAVEYLLGRRADLEVDWWHAGFLPRLLRESLGRVTVDGKRLAGEAEVVYPRQASLPRGDPQMGVFAVWGLAAVLATLALIALPLLGRRRPEAGIPIAVLGLTLGLLAIIPWVLTFTTGLRELRETELIVLLWPTDVVLIHLAIRMFRRRFFAGRWLRAYLLLRSAVIGAAVLGHATGLMTQRPLAWLAVSGLPMLLLWVATRQLPKRPPVSSAHPPGPLNGAPLEA
jgi:hypothetical protein